MTIRKIKKTDAKNFLALNKKLDAETPFLLFEPHERQTTLSEQEKLIETFNANGVVVFVLEQEGELLGFVGGTSPLLIRKKHCLGIAMGILQAYTGKGYGGQLLDKIEEWAVDKGIYRMELTVRVDNAKAIALYEKKGFQIDGSKKFSLLINNVYFDVYYMSKLLEANRRY